ncbi:MAG: ECF transporter S component [Eubacteriales bacterium]|nr:ECF transporter S component [Eubacteriales bacterium]
MKSRLTPKKIAVTGIMLALAFAATYFTRIPIPMTQGYFNIGDTIIVITAILLGPASGFLVGSIGSMAADLAAGYALFAPLTFVVKGVEGLLIGVIFSLCVRSITREWKKIAAAAVATIAGMLVMVAGYYIGEAFILGWFSEGYGYAAAAAELPLNILQGALSAVAGITMSTLLLRLNVKKYLE